MVNQLISKIKYRIKKTGQKKILDVFFLRFLHLKFVASPRKLEGCVFIHLPVHEDVMSNAHRKTKKAI